MLLKTKLLDEGASGLGTAATRGGEERPHAVVIGSGFGGLAAAVRLIARGYRVTVVEKLDGPGGRAYTYRRGGYTFDAGPTIVTVPALLEELWGLLGRQMSDDVKLQELDPFYRIRFDDGSHFDYSGDPLKMRAEIARTHPGDLEGYDRFQKVADVAFELGFKKLGAKAFDGIGDLVSAFPELVKMRAWEGLYPMVARLIKDPKLRIVLSIQSLLIGGNPFNVTRVYSLISALERKFGVHWAMGGTGELVRGLARLIETHGGCMRYNAPVVQIQVVPGVSGSRPRATGVVLDGGEMIAADLVVCNGDTAYTHLNLIDSKFRKHWKSSRVERGSYSMSLFVWYFGLKRQYPDVPHHMMLLGLRYQGLLDDIFKCRGLPEDFSLYLHRPTATDASMAPEGCDTFYALAPVAHLDSGVDWSKEAEGFRKRVAKRLDETVLPGFEASIEQSFMITPRYFADHLWSYKGAAFGLEPTLTQSAWFRPHNRSEDIDALYMVGASTHPGAGIPGVISSAKALDSVLPDANQWFSRFPSRRASASA